MLSQPAVPASTTMDKKTISLIWTAAAKRRPLKKITNALRLVNGLGDGLPGLVFEQYYRHYVIHLFDKEWIPQKEALAGFIQTCFKPNYLIIKERLDPKALKAEQINASVRVEHGSSQTVVRENGLSFGVDLNDGLNSGLFLDMRRNRKFVAGFTKGTRVLNCFAYTCSFGVYARDCGAREVVNVDISRKSLERGRANYGLNQLVYGKNEFVRADAQEFMGRAIRKGDRFGCVVLDPPSFARHAGKVFSIKKDLAILVRSALDVLEPGGILFVSTNFSGITRGELKRLVLAGGKEKVTLMKQVGQDADFPGSGRMPESYLAGLLARKL